MPDLIKHIVKNITYPLWLFRSGDLKFLGHLNKYKNIGTRTYKQLQDSQNKKLKSILLHAYMHSPFYKNIFDEAGLDPVKFSEPDNIRGIPILTKEIIRKNEPEIKSVIFNNNQLYPMSTGGSTGIPLKFYRDQQCLYERKAQEYYFDSILGWDIGVKTAYFVSASHYVKSTNRIKAVIRNLTNERMLRFDPHNITEEYMYEYTRDFNRFCPDFIKSFPNSLYIYARFLDDKNLQINQVPIVTCTGENLYQQQIELFRKVFNCDVIEKYASHECGVVCCECSFHKGLHVFTEGVYVEILDNNNEPVKPGEIGKIIITDLFNKGFPLIRYDIGDLAVQGDNTQCDCGSYLPRIRKIIGRDRDILIDYKGNPKPGYLLVEIINKYNIDCQFQILQDSRDKLLVKLTKTIDHQYKTALESEFKEIMGGNIDIKFEFHSSIDRDPSGKYRYVVSTLSL